MASPAPSAPVITVAQVGCGYWGPNLLRNCMEAASCQVRWVVEISPARRQFAQTFSANIRTTDSLNAVLDDPQVQAVLIATPAATHYSLARRVLESGRHALVEKPLALSSFEAGELAALAEARGLVLMIGHTFLYNDTILFLRELIAQGELGTPRHFHCQRLNSGIVRSDVNAWWNFAPHDVSLLLFLMDNVLPVSCTASGQACLQPGVEDMVYASLHWANGTSAHIHVSWLDPVKTRRLTVIGDRRMAVHDDTLPDPLSIIDRGFDQFLEASGDSRLPSPAGTVSVPHIPRREPLRNLVEHFLDCIRTGKTPRSDGRHGRDVVTILEAVDHCLRSSFPHPIKLSES